MFTTAMVESTQERVNMDGVEPEVVDMLLSFAYTSEVSISTANVQVMFYHHKLYLWSPFLSYISV